MNSSIEKERCPRKRALRNTSRHILLTICLLAGALSLAACSASDSSAPSRGSSESASSAPQASDARFNQPSAGQDTGSASGSESKQSADGAYSPSTNSASSAQLSNIHYEQRQVIYTAHLSLEVSDFEETSRAVQELVLQNSGYVLSMNSSYLETKHKGDFSLRIPQPRFFTLLEQVEALGERTLNKHVEGDDVTEQYVDLEARLRAQQAVEARLLEFMEKATKTEDLLRISEDLGRVQGEIESIKGKIRYLDENTAYSTLQLQLEEKIPAHLATSERPALNTQSGNALLASLNILNAAGRGIVIFFAGALPFLIIAAAVGTPLYFIWRKEQKKAASEEDHQAAAQKNENLVPETEGPKPENDGDAK